MLAQIILGVVLFHGVAAHIAPFAPGMYCRNGPQLEEDLNSNAIVHPLYQLQFQDFWFHHFDRCDEYPPPAGEFLELPAGGQFTVDLASNRAKSSMSYGCKFCSEWPNGGSYPEDLDIPTCITEPNLHAQNESMAAGTAWAISYTSDLSKVTPENLSVFTVLPRSPFRRQATYKVPAAMPACPEGGCICAWGWVAHGCGQPNMYMTPFRCKVTGSTSTTPIGTARPPVWCEDDPSKCVTGPKQMIFWHQASGDNIEVEGFDLAGTLKSPGYNTKCGFHDGAQDDIFTAHSSSNPTPSPGSSGTNKPSSPSSNNPVPNTPAKAPNSPSSNTTTSTTKPPTARKCVKRRSRVDLVKRSIVQGVASHLKRRRASHELA